MRTQSSEDHGEATALDPRVVRTRRMLQDALLALLSRKTFQEISVSDVTEEATLNRATFYAHYTDKHALLKCATADRFSHLLEARAVSFDGTCVSALRKIMLGICDYIVGLEGKRPKQSIAIDPYMESAIVGVVRDSVMDGLNQYPANWAVSQDILATTVSWAMYGAAKEWAQVPKRGSPECVADSVALLLAPLIHPPEHV